MLLWKYLNLFLSCAIFLLGLVTIFQFSVLVWQEKTPENVRKFKRLALRFGVLAALALVLQALFWLVRYLYLWGML